MTKLRWTPSLEHKYLKTTREHSDQMRTNVTGQRSWRTLRAGTYEKGTDMSWLEQLNSDSSLDLDSDCIRGEEKIGPSIQKPNEDDIDNLS